MTDNAIRLICFDLGRVLVKLCDNWLDAGQRAGVVVAEHVNSAAAREQLHPIFRQHEIGAITTAQFCQQVGQVVGVSDDQVHALLHIWLQGPFEQTHAIVAEACELEQIQTACLSNTNEVHWRQMTEAGSANFLPLDRMTYRFASQLIGHAKPDAAIYEHVEQVTGLRGEQIAFYDDAQANCQEAASRGWHTRQILPDREPAEQIREHWRELKLIP